MKKSISTSRRGFLKGTLAGAVLAWVTTLLPASRVRAADLPHVAEDDPIAQGLKYHHDATVSERPDETQFCHNCQYFQGDDGAEWGPCVLFPGKSVNANGWCNVWTKKA